MRKGRVTVALDDFGYDNVIAVVPLGVLLLGFDVFGMYGQRLETLQIFPIVRCISTLSVLGLPFLHAKESRR
jgi:hypothetical protein